MGRMSEELMRHPLDTAWQNVFTYASWGIVAIMLVVAVRMCLKQSTPFYVIAIAAAGIGAFAEPLYDVAFDLWFYDAHGDGSPGAMQSHFTAFDVVQPNWSHSGYIILYAMAPLYAGKLMLEGKITTQKLYMFWVGEIIISCIFECIGTGVDVYTYYGPYELRIFEYPLVIGVLEGTQTILFTVVAVNIWRVATANWQLLSLIIVFPITMLGGNFGLGWPVIIPLHLAADEFESAYVWIGTFLSIGMCAAAIRGAAAFLPKPGSGSAPDDPLPDLPATTPTREPVPA